MTGQDERPEHSPPSFLERLRRRVWQTRSEKLRDLDDLSESIEQEPTEAVHYLLRAGVHADLKQYQRAKDDYARALELAENDLESAAWGLSAQVIRDKALRGFRQMQRYVE